MNTDKFTKHNESLPNEAESRESEQLGQHWAALLSKTAQRIPDDPVVVPLVLESLRLERCRTADDSTWAHYLSSAARLQAADFAAVQPTLQALRLERQRVRQWRGSITRFIAGAAATAALVAAVAVFSPSRGADPIDAYSAYQEAARGW